MNSELHSGQDYAYPINIHNNRTKKSPVLLHQELRKISSRSGPTDNISEGSPGISGEGTPEPYETSPVKTLASSHKPEAIQEFSRAEPPSIMMD